MWFTSLHGTWDFVKKLALQLEGRYLGSWNYDIQNALRVKKLTLPKLKKY